MGTSDKDKGAEESEELVGNDTSPEPIEPTKKKKKKSKKKKKKKKSDSEAREDIKSNEAGQATISIEADTKPAASSDDDEDDDEDLLAAAALWAGDDAQVEKNEEERSQKDAISSSATTRKNLSLHITQLPYDSTEFDLRKLFAEHGCSVTSIRLVYDHDTEGRKTVFRGVAFIDLLDSHSYELALKLHHKTSIRGRRLNIRPCRTKEELADIVARTQELVQEKIRQQRSGEKSDDGPKINDEKGESNSSSPSSKRNGGKNGSKSKRKNSEKERKNKKPRLDKDGNPVKLTKKERNRRAAIIMQKRRRQKK